MDLVNQRRLAEADECVKRAENHLKTSIIKMKFKPDYDSAAIEYDRAAICCRNAGDLARCRDLYLKASSMHSSNGNIFHAAKCHENAAMVCKELCDGEGSMKYMELAADGYAQSGSIDTAAMALDKAAKFLEKADPEKAVRIYQKALSLVQQTDRSRMAGEFFNRLTKLYLKLERFSEAISNIDNEIDMYTDVHEFGKVGQLTTAIVLLELVGGDSIAASKRFQKSFKCEGFEFSEDARACADLISSYEAGDNECFQEIFQRPLLKSMDNEFLRLMKRLNAPDCCGNSRNAAQNEDNNADDLK